MDFTLPGHPDIHLIENGHEVYLSIANIELYLEVSFIFSFPVSCRLFFSFLFFFLFSFFVFLCLADNF